MDKCLLKQSVAYQPLLCTRVRILFTSQTQASSALVRAAQGGNLHHQLRQRRHVLLESTRLRRLRSGGEMRRVQKRHERHHRLPHSHYMKRRARVNAPNYKRAVHASRHQARCVRRHCYCGYSTPVRAKGLYRRLQGRSGKADERVRRCSPNGWFMQWETRIAVLELSP
jgi:hypothetical protein